ncbi:50S ribosomal protein L4 [Demequina litorisediminis]|uniref:Large ribosomal subunit protein uL4 n=2 Tax=Demequina litorisediminis TaxID=1849022 RepID=A0ABQ6IHN0_9MICO|nr:50S ribosomal protein L4 [Demequina litorisediminis]
MRDTMAETQTVDVLDAAGKKAGTADLPAEVFDVVTNVPLIHQVVVAQRAAARQGTHATKTRGEVAGGGKKPYKQKGTGRARQGSIRAPQFAGGGVVHGPQPRDYSQRTPKKMKAAALRGALSDRARAGRVHVLQGVIAGETPRPSRPSKPSRTSPTAAAPWWSSSAETSLAFKSLRNAAWIHVIAVDQINTYDVLVNDDTVFTAGALEAFLAGPATGKSATAVATESEAEETK